MRGVVALSGQNPTAGVLVLRVFVLAALAGLVAVVVVAARRTGIDAGAAVWAACASPLAVIHLAGGLHNEIFPLLACVAAVVLALDGRALGAGAAVGVAVAVKATAVIVAPFLLWILLARLHRDPGQARGALARALAGSALAGVAAAAVLGLITVASGTGSGWLDAIVVSDRVVNYLSLPTAVAHLIHALSGRLGFDDVLAATRNGGRVVLAFTLVAVWWTSRRGSDAALRGITLALLAFVLLNSLAWPWYHVWVGAFLLFARPGRAVTTVAVGTAVFLTAAIGPNGSTSLYSPPLVALSLVAAGAAAWWWTRATDPDRPTGEIRTPSPVRAS